MKKLLAVPFVTLLAGVFLLAQGTVRPVADQDKKPKDPQVVGKGGEAKSADEKALLESLYNFLAAFNRGDADALAKFFTEKAELVDDTGDIVTGREAIRKEYADAFAKDPGMNLEVAIDWFRWVSDNVVLQHGNAKLTHKDGGVTYSQYTAAHVKKEGKWLIAMIREVPTASDDGSLQESNLHALEWLVGDWVDGDDSGHIQTTVAWTRSKNFLLRTYSVTTQMGVELEGTEVISWDQSRGILRSWIFDTNGTFGEAIWLRRGENWYVRLNATLPTGKKAAAVHIYTPRGPNSYTFQSVGRSVDGEMQPDLDEVVVRRAIPQDNE